MYTYTKKGARTTNKFKTTKLPMIHTYTHKKAVSKTQNHSNANTNTHTTINTSNIKDG